MTKERFFNFPIVLLDGFLKEPKHVLGLILQYAVYRKALEYVNESQNEKMRKSLKYLGVTSSNLEELFNQGQELNDSLESGQPMVGLSTRVYWDYRDGDKSEFENICLLGYLAVKSILGRKAYCRFSNAYILSRMDGMIKSIRYKEKREWIRNEQLSPEIRKYANEYQMGKMVKQLTYDWGLNYYGRRGIKGFYLSSELDVKELVFQVEKKQKKFKEIMRKKEIYEAKKEVIARLNLTRP